MSFRLDFAIKPHRKALGPDASYWIGPAWDRSHARLPRLSARAGGQATRRIARRARRSRAKVSS
jgi:hypothetical protein